MLKSMLKNIDTNLSFLIFGKIIQVFLSFLMIRLATNLLIAEEMGNFYLITSIAVFFGFFLVGPIGQYINRKTHQWYDEKNLLNVFYIYNFYIIGLSFISVLIINILYSFHIVDNMNLILLSIIIFIYIISHTWNQTIIPMFNILGNNKSFVIFSLLSQMLYVVLAVIFVSIFSKEGLVWFFAQTISLGTLAIVSFVYFKRNIQGNFNKEKAYSMLNKDNFKELVTFSIPLFLGAFLFWLQTQSYPYIIKSFISIEFLGYFGVGLSSALAISSSFESIVMQYLYPKIYKSMNNEIKFSNLISKIINLIIPIYFLLALFVSIFAIFINSILVDSKYFNSYIFIIFGVWMSFFRMSSNIIATVAHSKMQTNKLILPNFVGASISIIGMILATKSKYYNIFVPLSLVLSTCISFTILYFKMNKIIKFKFKFKNILITFIYALPFAFGLFFYKYATNIFDSILIMSLFGFYFIFLVFKMVKKGNI